MKWIFPALFILGFSEPSLAHHKDDIKLEIIELSMQNTSNKSNRPQIRQELDLLVAQLIENEPLVTAVDWSNYSPGSWRQIWSDEADNSAPGSPQPNLEKVFQFVNDQGEAVNLGERLMPDGAFVTFALKAQGVVSGNIQNTKILEAFSRSEGLLSGEDIETLSNDILQNKNLIFTPTNLGEFPNGPINAESDLTILYLDNELKVGTAPNVYSGEIELFVLERQNQVQ